uniref:Putative pectate lyase n=1 Tax=viral metagenome TaxID=1070528 RepID=A0A6M3L1X9_9ZZZZ
MGVRKTPYPVNLQGGFSGQFSPGGQIFYVGASGYAAHDGKAPNDSNDGQTPGTCLATIQAALNKCVTGRGDTVAILPGSYTVTAALTMTSDDVTLCSAHPVGPRSRGPVVIVNATDVNTLTINANDCVVDGLTFDDNVATATADTAIIAVNTASTATDYTGTIIRNCYFDMLGSDGDRDGITLGLAGDTTDGALNSLVEGCVFLDCDQDALVIAAGSEHSVVRNCHIYDVAHTTRYGVECVGASCLIEDSDILSSGTACINVGLAAARTQIHNCNLHAWGADTFGIVAINTATMHTAGNWITATAAGNLIDYTTDNTTPSANADIGNIFAANAGDTALVTPTIDGS